MGSSSTSKEVDVWAASQLREKMDAIDQEDKIALVSQSPYVPDEIVETLSILKREYDPDWDGKPEDYDDQDPRDIERTERFQEIVERWISKTVSEAVRNGHDRIVASYLGVVEQETSIDSIQAIIRFGNWVCREAGITYLTGHMGMGKTDFGLLMLYVFYRRYESEDKKVRVATNIKSAAERNEMVEFIDNQPDLQKWLEKDGYKLFLFDEASSHASGYSGDATKVTKQMRSMVRLIRKSNGNMVIIGHDGKDLHPTVRELADYVEKEGKKEAAVFRSVEDREGQDKKFDITEIPETPLSYDTKEASKWKWAGAEDSSGKDMDLIIGQIYEETSMSQADVSDVFEVSQSKVSKCARKYRKWKDD